jgi:hypothetical protein
VAIVAARAVVMLDDTAIAANSAETHKLEQVIG